MKTLFTLTFILFAISTFSQTIEMVEATDEELLEYLQINHYSFENEQEAYYEKSRMWGFEYVIFYEDKPLYRGDILKPHFTKPHLFNNNNNDNFGISIEFLIPIDDLDKETQLELRANEYLMLITGNNGKKYIVPRSRWRVVNYKEKKINRYSYLAPKVNIKIYKTTLK